MATFEDIVHTCDNLMGLKPVWGLSEEPVMCFSKKWRAKSVAERSLTQHYFITIGAGKSVPQKFNGRILELVKATGKYGDTAAFVRNSVLKERLSQWPFAIVTSETYDVIGHPDILSDLGLLDKKIIANAYDGVYRDDKRIHIFWEKIKDFPVRRRTDILAPPGFYDDGKVEYSSTFYPRLKFTSPEGKRVYKLSCQVERSPGLKKAAKLANRERNDGKLVCEACGFSDDSAGMFDAHHISPVACGQRDSTVDDLSVLCPTCHRWAHVKGDDALAPLPISLLQQIRGTQE